jgi:hypothetical protein
MRKALDKLSEASKTGKIPRLTVIPMTIDATSHLAGPAFACKGLGFSLRLLYQ